MQGTHPQVLAGVGCTVPVKGSQDTDTTTSAYRCRMDAQLMQSTYRGRADTPASARRCRVDVQWMQSAHMGDKPASAHSADAPEVVGEHEVDPRYPYFGCGF